MADRYQPLVYLIGAGPGHPGLLTLRAVECLGRADLVLYDALVPPALLEHAPATAERICVRELAPSHPDRYQHIQRLLIDTARQGKVVARLKGGDPLLFGRGGEEAEALRAAGIPYEIVPGVTAGLALAYAGIPLTHRQLASAVAFVTGHEDPTKPGSMLNWAELARFPGTLVVYMGLSRLRQIVQVLIAHGKPKDTPACAMQWASTGRQRTVCAPLGDLPEAVSRAGLVSPTLVVIGSVVTLREQLTWFEQRPLFGRHVVVTRPRHQAGNLVRWLEDLGALVTVCPVIEIQDPPDWSAVDRAISRIESFDWLVFTSANGVQALLRRLRQVGRDLRALGGVRLAAIGPATAEALRGYQLEPDLVPPAYCSEALAAALKERVAGQRVLLARADRGRELLRDELQGVALVEQVAVYSQVDRAGGENRTLAEDVEYVTLTSSNIARVFLQRLDEAGQERIRRGAVQLVSISPVTSRTIATLGFPVSAEAVEYTTAGVVAALLGLVAAGDDKREG